MNENGNNGTEINVNMHAVYSTNIYSRNENTRSYIAIKYYST